MRKVKPETYKDMGLEMSSAKAAYYPSVNFDGNTLPEAKDWKVGKTYEVTLRLKMKSMSNRKGSDGKERGDFGFDIVAIEPQAEEVKESVSRYD